MLVCPLAGPECWEGFLGLRTTGISAVFFQEQASFLPQSGMWPCFCWVWDQAKSMSVPISLRRSKGHGRWAVFSSAEIILRMKRLHGIKHLVGFPTLAGLFRNGECPTFAKTPLGTWKPEKKQCQNMPHSLPSPLCVHCSPHLWLKSLRSDVKFASMSSSCQNNATPLSRF